MSMQEQPFPTPDEILKVQGLSCRYGNQPVLRGVSLQLQKGMLTSLLGPSGCGKSTLLNVVAGFHDVDEGVVWIEGNVASSAEIHVPPEKRNTGMIFQDYALFPHLSILQNVTFGLKGIPKQEAASQAREWLNLVRMGEYENRYPHELSGGQQQRVALARALAARPKLLLMDEPFSNLDTDLRRALVREVSEILRDTGTTAVLVTHDQEEAFIFGDQIGLMREGGMQQWGTPAELYTNPANRWVADFVGGGSWLSGIQKAEGKLQTSVGDFSLHSGCSGEEECRFEVLLRPHEVDLIRCEPGEGAVCKVVHREFTGQETRYVVEVNTSEQIAVSMDGLTTFVEGDEVGISLARSRPIIFEVQ